MNDKPEKIIFNFLPYILKVVRNEIDEINAGAHDNMTYEEIAKEMITQFFNVTGFKERWKSWS